MTWNSAPTHAHDPRSCAGHDERDHFPQINTVSTVSLLGCFITAFLTMYVRERRHRRWGGRSWIVDIAREQDSRQTREGAERFVFGLCTARFFCLFCSGDSISISSWPVEKYGNPSVTVVSSRRIYPLK